MDITTATNEFINSLNKSGYWPILTFLIIEQSIMYSGSFISFVNIFSAANIDYACNVPAYHSSLKPILNNCHAWDATSNKTISCAYGYKFKYAEDFVQSSIKADFGLVCENKNLGGMPQSCIMAGFFIGGTMGPLLADRVGRRFVTFISLLIGGTTGIIMGFANNIYLVICLSLVLGTAREVAMTAGFVYSLEFIPNNKQSLFGMLTQLLWAFNMSGFSILAYFLREWRYLQIIGSVPILLSGFMWFIVPESPRFLIVTGKFDKLDQLVCNFANKSNKNRWLCLEYESLKTLYQRHRDDSLRTAATTTQYSPLDIFRTRILFVWTVISILGWMFVVTSYYASTMLLVNIHGNRYAALIITSLMEIPSIILTFVFIGRGRNFVFLLTSCLCALTFITVGFLNNTHSVGILILSVIGKGCLSSLFYMVVVSSLYIYPTTIRSFGSGLPSAIGKLIAVTIPYFLRLYDIHTWLPTLIIGLSACFIGIINTRYPDWINRPLPETISDLDLLKTSVGCQFRCSKSSVSVIEV